MKVLITNMKFLFCFLYQLTLIYQLLTFPNVTAKIVDKYLTKYITSAKGHLDQQYKNCRSTSKLKLLNNNEQSSRTRRYCLNLKTY